MHVSFFCAAIALFTFLKSDRVPIYRNFLVNQPSNRLRHSCPCRRAPPPTAWRPKPWSFWWHAWKYGIFCATGSCTDALGSHDRRSQASSPWWPGFGGRRRVSACCLWWDASISSWIGGSDHASLVSPEGVPNGDVWGCRCLEDPSSGWSELAGRMGPHRVWIARGQGLVSQLSWTAAGLWEWWRSVVKVSLLDPCLQGPSSRTLDFTKYLLAWDACAAEPKTYFPGTMEVRRLK